MRTVFHRCMSALMLVTMALSLIYPAGTFAAPARVPSEPIAAAQRQPGPQLLLRAGAFDPVVDTPAVPPALQRMLAANQPGLRLVQFTGPIQDDWYTAMIKAGLAVVTYLPDYAYVVWGDGAAVTRLQANAALRWSGIYQPAYALSPDLAEQAATTEPVAVTVQLYNHIGVENTLRAIEAQADRVLGPASPVLTYQNLRLTIAADQLNWLAAQPEVVNVEPYVAPHKLDEIQDQIMAGNLNAGGTQPSGPGYLTWLTSTIGFTTTANAYPIVDVTDDGIDNGGVTPLHPDFWAFGLTNTVDRLIYNYNWTTDASANGLDGHGNLNASIVAGYNDKVGAPYEDGSGFNFGLGVNPFGRVAGSKVFANGGSWSAPTTNTPIISNTYSLGARISTNSWGSTTYGAYTTDDQEYDSLVRDAQPGSGAYAGNQPMITIFSAGNDGSSANTTGSPGNAKNVFTVGASENYRPTWTDGCAIGPTGADNAQDIIGFSSRGPTDDSRIKPDIVAPGTHIEGTASQTTGYNGSGVCDQYMPVGQTLYAASSGTSHSAPAVAGAASLLYRYYQDHFGGQPPSPAMTKAYLINATRYLTGTSANDTLPSNNQGLGEINLGTAFDTAKRLTIDQTTMLGNSGGIIQVQGAVADSTKPFRVTLAWTDAPGPTTGNAYVNNLDLAVKIGGQTYVGNVFSGRSSIAGGSADPRNNVESVFLPAGVSGAFTIIITGTNIAGDGVPGNADATDQDFALVVYNAAQDLGSLQGAVTAAGTGTPIVGATVQATSTQGSGSTTSSAGGLYNMTLLTGTYTVTASAYGYQANSISGVTIAKDLTTTRNITLTPVANYYVVSGTVKNATTGWPLAATIAIAGYPTGTVATNPVTGLYSVTLPGGSTYDFSVSAAGYLPTARSIGPLVANRTEDFTLVVDQAVCTAPGYQVTGWSENFDSVSAPLLPSGWMTTVVTSTTTLAVWKTATATVNPSGAAPHSAPNLMYLNSFNADLSGANRLYRTVGLDMSTVPTTTLSFWLYHDTGYTTYADRVQMQVSTNGGSSWTNVGAPVNRYDGSTGWKQHTSDLSAYAAQSDLRLGLLGISAYGNDLHLDDLNVGRQCMPAVNLYGVTLAPTANAKSGLAGSAVTYGLTITNTGNATDSFTVTIGAGTLFTNSVLPVTISNLAASATAQVTATVLIPGNAISGTQELAMVTVTSQGNPSQHATSTLTTTALINIVRGVGLTPISAAKSGLAGSAVTYGLTITNTGNATDSFTVTIGAGTLFTNSVFPATISNLASGATAQVTATVLIPGNAISGTQESAVVTVTSQGNPSQHATSTLTTTASINIVRGVGLTPISAAKSGVAGSAVTYALTITNTGNATDSFTVTIGAGTLFTNSVLPVTISNLASGATAQVTATVLISSNAISGTQELAMVTVTSQGNPSQHATSTLTTTAIVLLKVYLPLVLQN